MVREVVKWNKDFINDKFVSVKAIKEDNGLIGKVNIKLFDNEGNVTNETFTENIIINSLSEGELYRQMFANIAYGNQAPYGGNVYPGSFRNIILATNSDEENADELVCMLGSVIGWSPKKNTNAGSSKLRGVYNPNESYEKWENGYLHNHLVYDFGTAQGNGTFNSIWWGRDTAMTDDAGTIIVPMFCAEVTRPIGSARNQYVLINGTKYINQILTGANGSYYWYDPVNRVYKKILNGDEYVQGVSDMICSDKKEDTYSYLTELPKSLNDIPNSEGKYVTLKYGYSSGTTSTYTATMTLSLKDKDDSTIHQNSINFRNVSGVHTSMSISSSGSKSFIL